MYRNLIFFKYLIANEFQSENSLLSTVSQLDALVGARRAELVDFARFAHVDDFSDAVHGLGVVHSDADADETADGGLLEERSVNPLLQLVTRQTDATQLVFRSHKHRLLRFRTLFIALANTFRILGRNSDHQHMSHQNYILLQHMMLLD